jgi:hypothetical protein
VSLTSISRFCLWAVRSLVAPCPFLNMYSFCLNTWVSAVKRRLEHVSYELMRWRGECSQLERTLRLRAGTNNLFRMSMTSEYVSNELRRRLESTLVPRLLSIVF